MYRKIKLVCQLKQPTFNHEVQQRRFGTHRKEWQSYDTYEVLNYVDFQYIQSGTQYLQQDLPIQKPYQCLPGRIIMRPPERAILGLWEKEVTDHG
jgi:hypothetical protein